MQRLHTVALKDGTSIRVDMRQQTWCLLPDLLPPVPAANQSTEDEVTSSCGIPPAPFVCCGHTSCRSQSAPASAKYGIQLKHLIANNHTCKCPSTERADLRSPPATRGTACMQADVASSSMATGHDACKKPEACEALHSHSAGDLLLPDKAQPQVRAASDNQIKHLCMQP